VPTSPLDQLDTLKTQFGGNSSRRVLALLKRIDRQNISNANSLLQLHELLLFVRSHPHNRAVLRQADALLKKFANRISQQVHEGSDLSLLEHPEASGLAGLSVIDTFSFPIVRWLTHRNPSQLSFYWEWFEDENRIGELWPTFIPLLEEDTFVEANIPFREWLREARGKKAEVPWLVAQFDQLDIPEEQKSERYNAQKLYVKWHYSYRDSRTGLRGPVRKLFFHDGPLISRRQVRLTEELNKPALPLKRLSVSDSQRAIDLARLASTVRYRELYGFTNGDPRNVLQVDIGRGVVLQIISLPPDKRLPLRAYHAAMIYKNGVPIGYFEGLSLFERMESGFNLYYTFREGETAWLYVQILRVMRQITGVTSFSLDPYQIGLENEEGIQSGAFWFYRKLWFRSTSKEIQKLTEHEEEKIATREKYRTSAETLRQLARAPMILELDESKRGDWDHFQIRNIGFAVQRLVVERFKGDATRLRATARDNLRTSLNLDSSFVSSRTFEDFAVALLLVGDKHSANERDQTLLKQIVTSKCAGSEGTYLRLLQKHGVLRKAFLSHGST